MIGNLNKIVYSLTLTLCISTLISLVFRDTFWLVFTLTTILQITGFLIFNRIYTNQLIRDMEVIKTQQLTEANRNYTYVECPCTEKANQFVDIRFDIKNIYRCESCNADITATPNIVTTNVTNPIYFNQ
jgi:hypothetical protein